MTADYPAARMLLSQLRRAGVTPPPGCGHREALRLLAALPRPEPEEAAVSLDEIAAQMERLSRGEEPTS